MRDIKFNELLFVSGGYGGSCPGHFEGDVPPDGHVCQTVVIKPEEGVSAELAGAIGGVMGGAFGVAEFIGGATVLGLGEAMGLGILAGTGLGLLAVGITILGFWLYDELGQEEDRQENP
jgi:hypothetical protein